MIATAEMHFPHRIAFHDSTFAPLGQVNDSTVSDALGRRAPADVEVGESGDFYGIETSTCRG